HPRLLDQVFWVRALFEEAAIFQFSCYRLKIATSLGDARLILECRDGLLIDLGCRRDVLLLDCQLGGRFRVGVDPLGALQQRTGQFGRSRWIFPCKCAVESNNAAVLVSIVRSNRLVAHDVDLVLGYEQVPIGSALATASTFPWSSASPNVSAGSTTQ